MFSSKLKKIVKAPLIMAPIAILLITGCAERTIIPQYEQRVLRETITEHKDIPRPADNEKTIDRAEPITPPVIPVIPVMPEVIATEDLLLPVLTHVNERILTYEKKLHLIEELELKLIGLDGSGRMEGIISDCRFQVQSILQRYSDLHQQLLNQHTVGIEDLIKGETILNLWEDDFRFLASECSVLVTHADDKDKIVFPIDNELLNQKIQVITNAYNQRAYWQVVDEYSRLAAVHGVPLPDDITFLYGQSLIKIGQGADAAKILQGLLARVHTPEGAKWEYQLIQLIADIEFAHGNFRKAEQFYDKIVDAYHGLKIKNQWAAQQLSNLQVADEKYEEVRAYTDFLRRYLAYSPERDGFTVVQKAEAFTSRFPHSTVTSSVDFLKNSATEQAEQWYQQLIMQITTLAGEGNYQEALLSIERVPRMIITLEKQRELAALADKIRGEKSLTRAARQLEDKLLIQESWNEGITHLDSGRYDQAIESFSKLLTTSAAERAREKINATANHAAREDRRRAAELFIRANRTHDMESRKKLLLSSRQLLQDILIKYPQADVADKAKQNLSRIEQEIYNIDPGLLSAPVEMGGQQAL